MKKELIVKSRNINNPDFNRVEFDSFKNKSVKKLQGTKNII